MPLPPALHPTPNKRSADEVQMDESEKEANKRVKRPPSTAPK
jgi:hypothetical protein